MFGFKRNANSGLDNDSCVEYIHKNKKEIYVWPELANVCHN